MTSSVYAIGIMSGTSVDGIDVVLLDITTPEKPRTVCNHFAPFPDEVAREIQTLMSPGPNEVVKSGSLHRKLGRLYAESATALLTNNPNIDRDGVAVIGCHGQTIRHHPEQPLGFTVQLGCGATIAGETGIPTVTDFRSADMAAGGEGAPFAPFFHHAVFTSARKNRAIVNMGGIANITVLPKDENQPIVGFDSGPANGLMDAWIKDQKGLPFDRDGEWAASGNTDHELLTALISDEYFQRSAPKSTGRELFNLDWLKQHLSHTGNDIRAEDVQHTLAMLTVKSVIESPYLQKVDEIYVCGGGAKNTWLMQQLSTHASVPVASTAALGILPDLVEGAAFAWMAYGTLQKKPTSLPSVTGASRAVVNGAIYYP
ncbi:MAG: anhydro-N-acetylmuramic acid kinase [Acidiferrobacterales bacterium]|nr:anhydro-N-acetylmuramic acid kinase [Acidiferrobacterales bacterium]